MFFRLSPHSPRESGERRVCSSSWQILHFVSVRIEPGPEISLSGFCPNAVPASRARTAKLRLNEHSDPVPAVPEIAERVPARHRGLCVAAVVPRAREERHVARALRLVLVDESAPRVRMERGMRRELRALPALALVARNLDAVDRAFAHPRAAAHGERVALPHARV